MEEEEKFSSEPSLLEDARCSHRGREGGEEEENGCLGRGQEGDRIPVDARLVYLTSSLQFRSEFRVGTGMSKFLSSSSIPGLSGTPASSSSTAFGGGEEAMSISSVFDDDGLQPSFLQASLSLAKASPPPQLDAERCETCMLVVKTAPNPLPDFHQPVDHASQQEERAGGGEGGGGAELPLRKGKGKSDKRREDGVEMIWTPVVQSGGGEEETPMKVLELQKVLGLPASLWSVEAERSVKLKQEEEGQERKSRELRLCEEREGRKGQAAGQIDSASTPHALPADLKGQAETFFKSPGADASSSLLRVKDASVASVVRDAEWALEEFVRREEVYMNGKLETEQEEESSRGRARGQVATGKGEEEADGGRREEGGGEQEEVMEIKFDRAFANDEERLEFARQQRNKLAKLLGVTPESIEILEVKPGSPVTMIRFQISRQDASRLSPSSPPADEAPAHSSAEGGAAESFDAAPLGVEMLSAGDSDSHSLLTAKLQASLPPQVAFTDRAMQRRPVPSAPAEVMAGGGRRETGGQEAPERKLTVILVPTA